MPIAGFAPDLSTEDSSFGDYRGLDDSDRPRYHAAVDIVGLGNPAIYAINPGTVVDVERRAGVDLGRRVVVEHTVDGLSSTQYTLISTKWWPLWAKKSIQLLRLAQWERQVIPHRGWKG